MQQSQPLIWDKRQIPLPAVAKQQTWSRWSHLYVGQELEMRGALVLEFHGRRCKVQVHRRAIRYLLSFILYETSSLAWVPIPRFVSLILKIRKILDHHTQNPLHPSLSLFSCLDYSNTNYQPHVVTGIQRSADGWVYGGLTNAQNGERFRFTEFLGFSPTCSSFVSWLPMALATLRLLLYTTTTKTSPGQSRYPISSSFANFEAYELCFWDLSPLSN